LIYLVTLQGPHYSPNPLHVSQDIGLTLVRCYSVHATMRVTQMHHGLHLPATQLCEEMLIATITHIFFFCFSS